MGPTVKTGAGLATVLAGVLLIVAAALFASPTRSSASEPAEMGQSCRASLTISTTTEQATAHLSAACTGLYELASWQLKSPHVTQGETIYNRVTSPPWTVALPDCAWQVDFRLIDNRTIIAGKQGENSNCQSTTTTSSTVTTTTVPVTTTTLAPTTTTTSAPATTTTTLAPKTSPGGGTTTTTTLAPQTAPRAGTSDATTTTTAASALAFTGAPIRNTSLLGGGLIVVGSLLLGFKKFRAKGSPRV